MTAARCCQSRRKVGQQARLIRIELANVLLELLAIEGVQGQQFLDRRDNRHGVGLDLIALTVTLTPGVLDLSDQRPLLIEPTHDAETAKPLCEKLTAMLCHRGPMQSHNTAGGRELLRGRFPGVGYVDKGKTQQPRALLSDGIQRRLPVIRVERDRLHLSGEKGSAG